MRPLGEEEKEEAGADEGRHPSGVADRVDRLGQDVEECDSEHDAARECDQSRQLTAKPECDRAADERRDHGERGEGDRDPVHEQRLQIP